MKTPREALPKLVDHGVFADVPQAVAFARLYKGRTYNVRTYRRVVRAGRVAIAVVVVIVRERAPRPTAQTRSYDIERKDKGRWHGDIGESTGWPSVTAAVLAIKGLGELGPEWYGTYRVVSHAGRRVCREVQIGGPS